MPTGVYIHIKQTDKRNKICSICNKVFYCTSDIGIKRWNEKKYCSNNCYGESQRGKLVFDTTGLKHSEETKKKISTAHLGMKKPWSKFPVLKGENNHAWKGDNVSYSGLHRWIYRHLGKPRRCEHCGNNKKIGIKMYQWASKSREYKRDLTDWIRLCSKCHAKYDDIGKKTWMTRRIKIASLNNMR